VIRGLHHAGLATHDMDGLLGFYGGLLGLEAVFELEWEVGNPDNDAVVGLPDSAARLVMLRAGAAHLELFEFRNPVGRAAVRDRNVNDVGISHVCLDVDDARAEHDRLTAAGVTFHGPVQEIAGQVRVAYCRDPDGNVVELQEILDQRHPVYSRHVR
jgi:catechol 2,3-dioxygenase-like lactoylglutathione lyase family enzyme